MMIFEAPLAVNEKKLNHAGKKFINIRKTGDNNKTEMLNTIL